MSELDLACVKAARTEVKTHMAAGMSVTVPIEKAVPSSETELEVVCLNSETSGAGRCLEGLPWRQPMQREQAELPIIRHRLRE